MTAPLGREVERTLSETSRFPTWLSCQKALEADRQKLGDLGKPTSRLPVAGTRSWISCGHQFVPQNLGQPESL
jgi:hypothetical protein